VKQIAIALDQLLNTLCWFIPGGRWADETLSSRAWRIRPEWPNMYRVIDRVFFLSPDHCQQSYESELLRLQMPQELRGK